MARWMPIFLMTIIDPGQDHTIDGIPAAAANFYE
jgi:hypothetical protein